MSTAEVLARAASTTTDPLVAAVEKLRDAQIGRLVRGGLSETAAERACGQIDAYDAVLKMLGQSQKGRP